MGYTVEMTMEISKLFMLLQPNMNDLKEKTSHKLNQLNKQMPLSDHGSYLGTNC